MSRTKSIALAFDIAARECAAPRATAHADDDRLVSPPTPIDILDATGHDWSFCPYEWGTHTAREEVHTYRASSA